MIMKISVICPSEIAYRRFMPAVINSDYFEYAGVGYHSIEEIESNVKINCASDKIKTSQEKALKFKEDFGGAVYNSYNDVINDKTVDSIYIPLPPSFHYRYAKKSLLSNKHVMLEKPATLSYVEMLELVDCAKERCLALHENYMFKYHSQLATIVDYINSGVIGDVRLYRMSFGFPFRGNDDFRYNKALGGGALIDAGGYTIKLASLLLGNTTAVDSAVSNFKDGLDVDLYGQGVLKNSNNEVAQISFGMDNDYKCELEIWGSKGTLYTNRIFTAPVGFKPIVNIIKNGEKEEKILEDDNSFMNSIRYFKQCIDDENIRKENYDELLFQAKLFDDFKNKAGLIW